MYFVRVAATATLSTALSSMRTLAPAHLAGLHLVLNDPAGNSYVQSLAEMAAAAQEDASGTVASAPEAERGEPASEQLDERLVVEYYERDAQQRAFLGLEQLSTA